MASVEVESVKLLDLMLKVQASKSESGQSFTGDLETLTQEILSKITKSDTPSNKKLGILVAFMLWQRLGVTNKTMPAFDKLFEFRNGKAILKASKTDEELDLKISNQTIKDTNILSWIYLPQPGTPGTMRLSTGRSFIKKIVTIEKGTGGDLFGSIDQDKLKQPITQALIDGMPHPDLCVYFAHGKAQESPTDFRDQYEFDDEGEEMERNNDLDDMF